MPGSEIINNLIWFGAAVVVGLPILVGGLYYWARR